MKKWFYIGNYGCLAQGNQIDSLKDHMNDKGPEDPKKFESISFHKAYSMINDAKEVIEKEDTAKPKRKRRTKTEIEADKAS